MVTSGTWMNEPAPQRRRWHVATRMAQIVRIDGAAGLVWVRNPDGSEVAVPAQAGVYQVGAWVRVTESPDGRIIFASPPDTPLADGEPDTLTPMGDTGRRLLENREDARRAWEDAKKAQQGVEAARGEMALDREKVQALEAHYDQLGEDITQASEQAQEAKNELAEYRRVTDGRLTDAEAKALENAQKAADAWNEAVRLGEATLGLDRDRVITSYDIETAVIPPDMFDVWIQRRAADESIYKIWVSQDGKWELATPDQENAILKNYVWDARKLQAVSDTASGRAKIYIEETDAHGDASEGDVWWKVVNKGQPTQTIVAQWTYTGGQWTPSLIRDEVLAYVTAAKLRAGTGDFDKAFIEKLVADDAFFNSVVASRMVVTGDNLFRYGAEAAPDGVKMGAATWDDTEKAWRMPPSKGMQQFGPLSPISVKKGTKYRFDVEIKPDQPGQLFYLRVRGSANSYPFLAQWLITGWGGMTAEWENTNLDEITHVDVWVDHSNSETTDAGGAWLRVRLRSMADADLIVDGSISARHIQAQNIGAAVGDFVHVKAQNVKMGEGAQLTPNGLRVFTRPEGWPENAPLPAVVELTSQGKRRISVGDDKGLVSASMSAEGDIAGRTLSITGDTYTENLHIKGIPFSDYLARSFEIIGISEIGRLDHARGDQMADMAHTYDIEIPPGVYRVQWPVNGKLDRPSSATGIDSVGAYIWGRWHQVNSTDWRNITPRNGNPDSIYATSYTNMPQGVTYFHAQPELWFSTGIPIVVRIYIGLHSYLRSHLTTDASMLTIERIPKSLELGHYKINQGTGGNTSQKPGPRTVSNGLSSISYAYGSTFAVSSSYESAGYFLMNAAKGRTVKAVRVTGKCNFDFYDNGSGFNFTFSLGGQQVTQRVYDYGNVNLNFGGGGAAARAFENAGKAYFKLVRTGSTPYATFDPRSFRVTVTYQP